MTLQLTDDFGQVQTVADFVRRVGFDESTASTLPAISEDDDWSAWDGAIGDLDNDFRVDDIVITTYNVNSRVDVLYGPDPNGVYLGGVPTPENAVGEREVYTRMFFRQADGRLTDQTGTRLPAVGDDASGHDDLNALAVAIGDIDGDQINDIVLGGSASAWGIRARASIAFACSSTVAVDSSRTPICASTLPRRSVGIQNGLRGGQWRWFVRCHAQRAGALLGHLCWHSACWDSEWASGENPAGLRPKRPV